MKRSAVWAVTGFILTFSLRGQSYELKPEKEAIAKIEAAAASADNATLVSECDRLLENHHISAYAWFLCGKHLLSVKTNDLKLARAYTRTAYVRLEKATRDFKRTGKQLYLALDGEQYMGLAAMLLGDLDRAQVHFRSVLARDNRMASAWYNLGVIYELKGLNEESMRSFDRYLRIVGASKESEF